MSIYSQRYLFIISIFFFNNCTVTTSTRDAIEKFIKEKKRGKGWAFPMKRWMRLSIKGEGLRTGSIKRRTDRWRLQYFHHHSCKTIFYRGDKSTVGGGGGGECSVSVCMCVVRREDDCAQWIQEEKDPPQKREKRLSVFISSYRPSSQWEVLCCRAIRVCVCVVAQLD